jgi:spore coat protein U-like protein
MFKFRSTLLILVGSLAFVPMAMADDSDNLTVHASVEDSCVITGAALDFGIYDTITRSAVSEQADLTVACTRGATAIISLGEGVNADTGSLPAAPLRRLVDGAGTHFLSYSLYSDSFQQDAWTATGVEYDAVTSSPEAQTVYGRLEAGQDVVTGDYTDTVLATISL